MKRDNINYLVVGSLVITSYSIHYTKLYEPLHKAVTDPISRPRVEALVAALDRLKQLIVGDLATTLEIPIGFNSLDGD